MSASCLLHPDKRTLIVDFCMSVSGQLQTIAVRDIERETRYLSWRLHFDAEARSHGKARFDSPTEDVRAAHAK
jgi:hypothetical protein